MSRTIFVLGTGRSGTSAVAGTLHALGCHMGDVFHPSDATNPYGTFEDCEWMDANRMVLKGTAGADIYRPLIAARDEAYPAWGVKDPALARTLGRIAPLVEGARVVVVKRNRADTINSYMRAYRAGRARAEKWYEAAIANVAARLLEFDGPVLEVRWEDLLDDPGEQVRRLMHFAFDGLDVPGPEQFTAAVKHIHRKPKREPEGWGNLAVGVRIAKHPEVGFFRDWTKLLTGGLRTGDTVLMPQSHQPAHWASTHIARDFLRTDKDSLLMIDDDMAFPMDAAHRLRENRDNWEYDIVMAFATHRTWPPKPVVLKLHDEPGESKALLGSSFGYDIDIERGQVVETDTTGLAFTLIRRRVLEAMVDDEHGLDYTFFFSYGPGWESDDIPFCREAAELGFRMAIDASVCIGHIGARAFGWEQFAEWRDSLPATRRAFIDYDMEWPVKEHTVDIDADALRPVLKAAAQSDDETGEMARSLLEAIENAAAD